MKKLTTALAILLFSIGSTYAKPPFPVIFLHGLGGDANGTWGDFATFLRKNDWQFSGCLRFSTADTQVINEGDSCLEYQTNSDVSPDAFGGFYVVNFSDNNNLTFKQQAQELDAIIHYIQSTVQTQTYTPPVGIVAHSMGGLAARWYLQELAPGRGDIPFLITIGAPHQGSYAVNLLLEHMDEVCLVVSDCYIPIAIPELHPDQSVELLRLNSPESLMNLNLGGTSYTSIVIPNYPSIRPEDGERKGDGIVTAESQNLAALGPISDGTVLIPHSARKINIPLARAQRLSSLTHTPYGAQAHTAEAHDFGVWAVLLSLFGPAPDYPNDPQTVQSEMLWRAHEDEKAVKVRYTAEKDELEVWYYNPPDTLGYWPFAYLPDYLPDWHLAYMTLSYDGKQDPMWLVSASYKTNLNYRLATYATPKGNKTWQEWVAWQPVERILGQEFTPWHTPQDYQATFDQQLAESKYPTTVEGRNNNGASEYRAQFVPSPQQPFEFWSYHGFTESEYNAKNSCLEMQGYQLTWLQHFTDATGIKRHQATWTCQDDNCILHHGSCD